MFYPSRIRILIPLLLLSLIAASCNLPIPLLSNPEGSAEEGSLDLIDLSAGDAQGADNGDQSSDQAQPALGDSSMADFRCPDSPEPYALWFKHAVKYDTPGFGTWDIVSSGMILLSVAEGLTDGTVHMPFSPGQVVVNGTASGNFGRGDKTCSFEAPMEVIVNIDGICDRGVVHLNIVENWGDIDTSISCCSGEDCDTGPFQWMLPVVQYEDVQFTAANGYQVSKPFGGGGGTLNWSLAAPIEPVPLTE
ncbi:MAG: hypothetical protein ACLFWD_09580 [Anaerolineales bacterium]